MTISYAVVLTCSIVLIGARAQDPFDKGSHTASCYEYSKNYLQGLEVVDKRCTAGSKGYYQLAWSKPCQKCDAGFCVGYKAEGEVERYCMCPKTFIMLAGEDSVNELGGGRGRIDEINAECESLHGSGLVGSVGVAEEGVVSRNSEDAVFQTEQATATGTPSPTPTPSTTPSDNDTQTTPTPSTTPSDNDTQTNKEEGGDGGTDGNDDTQTSDDGGNGGAGGNGDAQTSEEGGNGGTSGIDSQSNEERDNDNTVTIVSAVIGAVGGVVAAVIAAVCVRKQNNNRVQQLQ